MNRRSRVATLAIAGIAVLLASLATATTVQKFSLSDLARKSSAIVLARVEDETARRDEATKEIYTYFTLRVLEPVKGAKGEETITIRQLGGTLGNVTSIVPGMPTFRRGEEVVVFLTQKDAAGYPWIMGLQQGKYSVVSDEHGHRHVRNELDGLTTMAPDGSRSDADRVSKQQPLQAFLDGIKTQLDLEGKVRVDPTTPTE